jgi:ankyrin repeat protein
MRQGADIDHRDGAQCTPLHHAVFGGSVDTVRWILQAGADVNAVNDWFGTPLCLAAIRNDLAITKLLIKHKADRNQDCFNLGSAAHAACASGNIAIVQTLHAAGVSWDTRRNICVDALSHLSQPPQKVGSLAPYHKSLATQTCQAQSPGAIAVKFRHPRVVGFCLDQGLPVDEIWKLMHVPAGVYLEAYTGDATLVMLAMSTLDLETGEALLTHGANANAEDAAGRGALIYAVDAACLGINRDDFTGCVSLLLSYSVDIDGAHKRTVRQATWREIANLEYLMIYGVTTVALASLQGIYKNQLTSTSTTRRANLERGQETSLMHVIDRADNLSSCKHCVEVLCEHGAYVDVLDFSGNSAMDMAILRFGGESRKREQEVTDLLLRYGATFRPHFRSIDYVLLPDYGYWRGILVR